VSEVRALPGELLVSTRFKSADRNLSIFKYLRLFGAVRLSVASQDPSRTSRLDWRACAIGHLSIVNRKAGFHPVMLGLWIIAGRSRDDGGHWLPLRRGDKWIQFLDLLLKPQWQYPAVD
jgi:hypothetical protein